MEKQDGRALLEADIARAERPQVENMMAGETRVRSLKEWYRAQNPNHEIRQFKVVGEGRDEGKCLVGYKNMVTKKTIITEIRRPTLEESLKHGVKKWGKKFKHLANLQE